MDHPTTGRTPFVRACVLVVAVAGSALAAAFFLFVDLGGTVRGAVHPLALVAVAVWAGPFWIYARMVRTRWVALVGGAALLGATTAFLVPLFRNTHSTAAIGVITIPMVLYPLAVGVLAIDRLLSARRTEPALRGLARRTLALGVAVVATIAAVVTVVEIAGLFDPMTRDDLVYSVMATGMSAMAATGGLIAIKLLWRVTPPPPPRDRIPT